MWLPRRVETFLDRVELCLGAIENALKQKINAVPVDDKATHDKQREAAGMIAAAIETTANAQSSYEQPQRHKEYRVQVFIVILTFLTAAGALAAAFASWRTLPAIKKSADAAYTAAQATQDQVDATYAVLDLQDIQMRQNRLNNARAEWMQTKSLKQSEKSLQANIDQAHLDQRAWLAIKDMHGSPSKPSVTFTNTGHTPALEVEAHVSWQWIPDQPQLINPQQSIRLGLVSPETERTLNIGSGPEQTDKPLYTWGALPIETYSMLATGCLCVSDFPMIGHNTSSVESTTTPTTMTRRRLNSALFRGSSPPFSFT